MIARSSFAVLLRLRGWKMSQMHEHRHEHTDDQGILLQLDLPAAGSGSMAWRTRGKRYDNDVTCPARTRTSGKLPQARSAPHVSRHSWSSFPFPGAFPAPAPPRLPSITMNSAIIWWSH